MTSAARTALERVLDPEPGPFALLHRPESGGRDAVDVLFGAVATGNLLADVPLPETCAGPRGHDVLVVVPYRQIAERGFAGADDGSPLITLSVSEQHAVPLSDVLREVPDAAIDLRNGRFDVDDETHRATVEAVTRDEIGTGAGANFVLKRNYLAEISEYTPACALTLFRRLLEQESGAYWTFLVHTGDRTFVGATPERHISVSGGNAVMNPISGTYRYPPSGPTLDGVMEFLTDPKEIDELYMVVDEELKMMSRICGGGARVVGPFLKEMQRLAHTEYFIEGRTNRDVRDILRETMFAPTVTGSPLESATRVIDKYEPGGRGYYSGVFALIGRDGRGGRTMDSAIAIRTADIDRGGRLRIGVGSTLVRHSEPDAEVAETRAKADGLLAALRTRPVTRLGEHPRVLHELNRRNATIARFWLAPDESARPDSGALSGVPAGRRVLIVDAEDTFTSMIAHQLTALGVTVTVRRFDERYTTGDYDIVVMGPGPGDPTDGEDPKIAHLDETLRELLHRRQPFLAVCLSHQVLAARLGLRLSRKDIPNQGLQREIDLFGAPERVGFYNTFVAQHPADEVQVPGIGAVEISRDEGLDEVHALRGPFFASMQFHAESVLTQDGLRILATLMDDVFAAGSRAAGV